MHLSILIYSGSKWTSTDTKVDVYSHQQAEKIPHDNSILLCSKRISIKNTVLNKTTILKMKSHKAKFKTNNSLGDKIYQK